MDRKLKVYAVVAELMPYAFFAWYFGLCVYYYKARITYGDTGYYLFKMIQHGNFNIESGRAISVLTQWLPVLLIKCGAPLRIIMMAYSVNFALFYFICFIVTRYVLRSYFLAWGVILCMHISQHYGFYYPTEMIFSAAYIIAVMAYFTYALREGHTLFSARLHYGVGVLLLLIVLFIHPFYFIIIGMMFGGLWLLKRQKDYLVFSTICVALLFVKLKFLLSGYEAGKMSGIHWHLLTPRAVDQSYLTFFWRQSYSERLALAKFAFYFFVLWLIWNRKYLLALAMPIGYLILYLFVYCSIPQGESLGYMECYMVAISVFPLIIFLVYAEEHSVSYKLFFAMLAFVVSMCGLVRIKSEPMYKERVKYLERIFAYGREKNISKFFVEENEVRNEKILVGWALPYETLLLSTVSGKTQTVFINTAKYHLEEINNNRLFLGVPWEKPAYDLKLNEKYFKLDTVPYIKINGMDF